MYLSQQVQRAEGNQYLFYLMKFKVILNPKGRPCWQLLWSSPGVYSRRGVRQDYKQSKIPFMSRPAPGKPVLMREAEILTGLYPTACIDYLTENVNDSKQIQNYVKPKKPRKKKVK